MTPELYWYALTETVHYYAVQIQLVISTIISGILPHFAWFLLALVTVCTGYAYIVNLRRAPDDPLKRNYYRSGILFAPITFILSISLALLTFVVLALGFGVFLMCVAVVFVIRRKPLIFILWHKFAMKIGEPLLKINARLIRAGFGR